MGKRNAIISPTPLQDAHKGRPYYGRGIRSIQRWLRSSKMGTAARRAQTSGRPYYGRGGLVGRDLCVKSALRAETVARTRESLPTNRPSSIVGALLVRALGWGGSVFLVVALLLVLALPSMSGVAHAASRASTGHISGQLLNGTHKNAPVANQSVTLQMAQGNSARDLVTITTDAQGHYAFSSLESDSSVQYAVYTLYQGAQYFTDLIDLSKNSNQQANLTIYDATSDASHIAVVQASILLDKPNQQTGMLTVSEDYVFANLSSTTYVGKVDATHGKPNALSFPLPTGARFLSLDTGFNGYTGTQVNTGFASNAAVPPGTSEFSFSFQVPYSGNSYNFTYKTIYRTASLSVLTPTDFSVTPQGLTAQGPTNTSTGTYLSFQAQTVAANSTVGMQLGGLPTPKTATASTPSITLSPGLLWLVIALIVLIILVGIGGYIYQQRKQRETSKRKPAARKNVPTGKKAVASVTKESLLQEMLELDKAFDAGKLKKAAYQEQRARLKNRLRPLMDEEEKGEKVGSKTASKSGKGAK